MHFTNMRAQVGVHDKSPASAAGLVAGSGMWCLCAINPKSISWRSSYSDYIIGSPDAVLQTKDDLFALVEQSVGRPVRLFVYNWKTNQCREVCAMFIC